MTDWNRLWANELSLNELQPAQIVMFMKSSFWLSEPPGYGFVDALISSLDLTPFTHTGVVAWSPDGANRSIVHSDHNGVRNQRVERCASPHRFGDLFIFEATHISPESGVAVAEHAMAVASQGSDIGEDRSYPFADSFLLACLMRVRTRTNFDEQLHRRIARIVDLLSQRPNNKGRMCAPFVASMFGDMGVPLDPPSERALYDSGVTNANLVSPRLQTVEGLRTVGESMGSVKDQLITALDELGGTVVPELEGFRQLVSDLDNPETQQKLAEWLFSLGAPHDEVTAMVLEACQGLENRFELQPGRDLAERFASCNDLVLSPTVRPVGHVRMWHSLISDNLRPPDLKEHP